MSLRYLMKASLTAICVSMIIYVSKAQGSYDEKHIEVSLRMIGHQVLLQAGDSTSRVLPIIRNKNVYRIQFESEFSFEPEELIHTANKILSDTKITDGYIMEVQQCVTGAVVYSYEIGDIDQGDVTPCKSRDQPKSCYNLLFNLSGTDASMNPIYRANTSPYSNRLWFYGSITSLFLFLTGLVLYLRKKKKTSITNIHLISIGKYHFDQRKSELILDEQRIELSSKEADLLLLLYHAANTTVEREILLNKVWGDLGDYVGRTLDVFISKLRKKLNADSSVKIVNIRGVGYKLVLDT